MRNILKALILGLAGVAALAAETGRDAWLRYAPLEGDLLRQERAGMPAAIVSGGSAAQAELIRGVRGMLGRTLRAESQLPAEGALIVGTTDALRRLSPSLQLGDKIEPDGYLLRTALVGGTHCLVVTGSNERGVLYGAFALLRKIASGEPINTLNERQTPYAPIRWINQWDNLDGSIERGYGGRSIFWENGHARADLSRVSEYGRLLASIGINATTIDNVNADKRLLSAEFVPQVARIAAALRPWGVQVAVSVDFGSPQSLGGLNTFDPLDPQVADWWKARADDLYRAIPDLAGFVLKADSEGRVGPSAYKRTHADAANVVARALKAHGGLLLYRGFVYDHHMDWTNPRNDRARAAYDNFQPLDGQFDDNVVIQIKNGPIDFQVREPVSPLIGALRQTNQALELQVTQEYMGQGRHTVFLAPQWKEALDFDLHATGTATPMKEVVAGRTFRRPTGGFIGVTNVGLDDNWLGNHFSQANLYGFGRLAWDPNLSAAKIVGEWTRLTFGNDPKVVDTIDALQLTTWRTYENYTGPLGLQTLTDIVGNHYGVSVEASEKNGWGQWHRADERGVGMDRTVATGTGYVGQYAPSVAHIFDSLQDCPDDLLLFMHHVPYTHVLHSGKTVIQSIYDLHYAGAETAARYVSDWQSLKGRVDDERYAAVLQQLEYQAGQAEVWRDAVAAWFLRESGIADAQGRVGHDPHRVEAESMRLDGYRATDIVPWEAASGGKAVVCSSAQCKATAVFQGESGWYTLRVRYFDQPTGVAQFRVKVGTQTVDSWIADDRNPARKMDASSSALRVIRGIALRPGDEIAIEGVPDRADPAGLDYVEIETPSQTALSRK